MSFNILLNAVIGGVMIGAFYAAIACGLAIAFGVLEVPNLAHPAVVVLAGFMVFGLNAYGIDPVVAGLLLMPVFYLGGIAFYRAYQFVFEDRGDPDPLRSFSLFFGVAFLLEVALLIYFGADLRSVDAFYIGRSLAIGEIRIPYRLAIAFIGGTLLLIAIHLFLKHTILGQTIRASGHDREALRLFAINPSRIRQIAFGVAIATAALAGAFLIIIGPIDPSSSRLYIGRALAIVVLAGMGSISGTYWAAILFGIAEGIMLATWGASWAPAISFGLVILVLAIRPAGLFGRA
jgi:branched-chain amino acid transport system permease protein